MANKSWSDLSSSQKRVVVVAGALEAAMTVAALRDLSRRPDSRVRGSKRLWSLGVMVQPVGPVAYFLLGRR